jgi:small subunit ribosomal protein S20
VANIKSQIKRNRQNEGRRLRNKSVRSSLKTSTKKVLAGAGAGEDSETVLREALRELDRAQSKGILHKRSAARRKSRLTRAAGSATVRE